MQFNLSHGRPGGSGPWAPLALGFVLAWAPAQASDRFKQDEASKGPRGGQARRHPKADPGARPAAPGKAWGRALPPVARPDPALGLPDLDG